MEIGHNDIEHIAIDQGQPQRSRWQFWIDRGGTFTDIVAQSPDRQIIVHKLLSENPQRYSDAPIQAIRDILGLTETESIPIEQIAAIQMGTTVATNALLERKGDRTVLLITKGFGDALRIGYQNRPDIFAQRIILPEMLYERVIEVSERYSAHGELLIPLDTDRAVQELQIAYDLGIRSCAIALLHGYRYHDHEQRLAAIAQQIGFTQISVSHEISSLIKFINRADTTVVDAYLSPILKRYVDRFNAELQNQDQASAAKQCLPIHELGVKPCKLMFMQSNGGLTDAKSFRGKNSILSGPAGGIVGAVQTCLQSGFDKIISFDMGGTSTDVAHYAGHYERSLHTEVAGIRISTPMMAIHTVAAGGGSLLRFDGSRYRVGPASAGAFPGPACYRNGGALAVTDCNVMLGRLQPEYFPAIFGKDGKLPLDRQIVKQKFKELAEEISLVTGQISSPEAVAQGFLEIAVEKMAMAIKKISIQRGYDVSEYVLCCFGGAGGQHACAIADLLGISQIFIHPYAGVLSAYGIGLADVRTIRDRSVEEVLTLELLTELAAIAQELSDEAISEINTGDSDGNLHLETSLRLRYLGTDSALEILLDTTLDNHLFNPLQNQFTALHQERYGFIFSDREIVVEAIAVEAILQKEKVERKKEKGESRKEKILEQELVQVYVQGEWRDAPILRREDLQVGDRVVGAALIVDATGTNVIEPNWEAALNAEHCLILRRINAIAEVPIPNQEHNHFPKPDPIKLEIFNNLFQAIAEQMGFTLQNTSASVNIRERLDFSCAIFDRHGELVANAPHIPVHLGSMGESVKALIRDRGNDIHNGINFGDVFATNNPYNGGTHLPDLTLITPVFIKNSINSDIEGDRQPTFFVASRGHHADIGGITPGSMPSHSTNINEEGILFDNFQVVKHGNFCEAETIALLQSSDYPARNPQQNIADIKAQIAANECGVRELQTMVKHYGIAMTNAYMGFVRDNAELAIRKAIAQLAQTWQNDHEHDANQHQFIYPMDGGSQIQVAISLNAEAGSAKIDFTGTSPQSANNFNAPLAVCKAVVLYVFRTLVTDGIPLNGGCLVPLEIIVPEGSLLNPVYPAAVVAGNVETSQAIANALYGALGVMAASQGTMNNFTFGSDRYQYYETICGGSGAGIDANGIFAGTDAVQTHMTNSRLTDPEILEWRFPVLLEQFAIRANSGGLGKGNGGNGVIRKIKFLEPMTAAILSSSRAIAPFGLKGGASAQTGRNYVIKSNGAIVNLPSTATVIMESGDIFAIETPGGGGYGS